MWAFDLEKYFSFQIFFIILRETIEAAIIVSVLLSFINQNSHDAVTGKLIVDEKLVRWMRLQVWVGAFSGFFICMIIGAIFIGFFYLIGTDLWSYAERIWEGFFSILSSLIIAVMGVALLRINGMKSKWKASLSKSFYERHHHDVAEVVDAENVGGEGSIETRGDIADSKPIGFRKKYFLGFLPFITTLREGLEAVVFIGGIGVNQPVSSFPLAIITGGLLGFLIGFILYSSGNKMSIQYFLILSTCFLYLIASGLMSRGVWFLELEVFVRRCNGQDPSESGSGPGSYDIANCIWHVNCCNGLKDGGWMILNALFGWSNTATYGSIISYIVFWIIIIAMLRTKRTFESNGFIEKLPIKMQLKKIKKRLKMDELMILEIEEMNSRNRNDRTKNLNIEREIELIRNGSSTNDSICTENGTAEDTPLL